MVKTAGLCFVIALALGATAGLATGTDPAGCPTTAPTPPTPTPPTPTPNASHPARGVLVVKGATKILLCRYDGLNPAATAHHLERARLLTAPRQVTQLTTELDALPQVSGVMHCPMDDGSEITAMFSYPRTSAATVYVGLTGCRSVSRGRLVRSASGPAGSRLFAQLSALDPEQEPGRHSRQPRASW